MRSPKILIAGVFCLICLVTVDGCLDKADKANASAQTLAAAAQNTYIRYLRLREACEIPSVQDIPRLCWAEDIRALHPIRVYLHRCNVVVVQNASEDMEEGRYVCIPISSYLPQSGDDGFTFGNQSGPVLDFRRTVCD